MVPEAEDALRFDAEQHIHEVPRAEALPGPVYCRERLLCRNCSVPSRDRVQTIVTIAAGQVVGFAEITEQNLPSAGRGLAIADQRFDFLPFDAALVVRCLTRLEQAEQI